MIIAGIVLQPEGRTARVLGWGPLAYVGLVSYGLYLWHPVVFRIFEEHVHLATFREKATWGPAMLGITAFNRLKDRLPRGRRLAVDAGHVEATAAAPSGGGRHRPTT